MTLGEEVDREYLLASENVPKNHPSLYLGGEREKELSWVIPFVNQQQPFPNKTQEKEKKKKNSGGNYYLQLRIVYVFFTSYVFGNNRKKLRNSAVEVLILLELLNKVRTVHNTSKMRPDQVQTVVAK